MNAELLRQRVAEVPYWYHRIELPGGVVTPGWAPLEPAAYRVPEDLSGARVLDVGAWDGYWCFEALRRGAQEVVAVDDLSDRLGFLTGPRDWRGFDLCRAALGYDEARCRRLDLDLFALDPDRHGSFDVVLFFGVLYHVRYPLLALDRLAAVCRGSIHVESAILDDFSPYRGGLGRGYPDRDQIVMEHYPGAQYGGNETNWWVPTLRCLAALLTSAGFGAVETWKLDAQATAIARCRGFASAQRSVGSPAGG